MYYDNLQHLIAHSASSRQFLLSLPVSLQLALHEYSDRIHTAAELHRYADTLPHYLHAVAVSESIRLF